MTDNTNGIRKMCACGVPVHKGNRCRECFNRAHRENQGRKRLIVANLCRCGAKIGAKAKLCRSCNLSALGGGKYVCQKCGTAMIRGRCKCSTDTPREPGKWADQHTPAPRIFSSRWEEWEADKEAVCPQRARFVDRVDKRLRGGR